ncbi:MAG: hypothetical protein ACK4MV_10755 [Beijerinckiaceae bacterium]
MSGYNRLSRILATLDLLRRREEGNIAHFERSIGILEEERRALFTEGTKAESLCIFVDLFTKRAAAISAKIETMRTKSATSRASLKLTLRQIDAVKERMRSDAASSDRRAEELNLAEWLDSRQASEKPGQA